MEMRILYRRSPRLALAALLLVAGCRDGEVFETVDPAERGALARGDSNYNEHRVRQYLYDEGLIRVGAIRVEVAAAVRRCESDAVSRESAMRQLRYIIEDWRASHHAEADVARRLESQKMVRDGGVPDSAGASSLDAQCGAVSIDGIPPSPPGIIPHSESPLRWIGSSDHSGRGF